MRRFWFLTFAASSCLLAAGACPTFCFSADPDLTLDAVELGLGQGADTVELLTSRPFEFITYTLQNPPRLVIDSVEPGMKSHVPESGSLGGQWVQGWRVVKLAYPPSSSAVDYLELQLAGPAEHRVEHQPGRLLVRVRPKGRGLLPPTGAAVKSPPNPVRPAARDQSPPLPDRARPEPGLTPGPWSIERALDYGLTRHRPVRIARQEVELAQMKVREAKRAIYPAATLKTSWTEGTASEIDFREYSTGLQLEHPLLYSGRLTEAYRQSLVNLQVAEKRQHKVKADYAMELSQEYYQLIGAHLSRDAQAGLIAQTEEFLQQAEARFEKGLITRLELLNVQAQVNQAKFQRANAENDLLLARFKFLQRLGLDPEAAVEVPEEFAAPSLREIDLEELLQLTARYRPDIQVNSLLVKFHEHEERIAKAKGGLKVDLSGFIGQSAAAFETEPLDAAEDYFVGIKATKAWGPHSTTASATTTKTSPRLGQTTRTDSTVYSAEMGILDQLQGLSEVKQAQVNLNKARRELEEAKDSAFQEAQEAHISYNKARLQLEHAQQKIAFREEQVKILKAQAGLNEALPSQVLEAVMKVTDEKAGRAQAVSSYYVALAKLNKAIGLAGHYK